jgi:hypothetical protein
MTPELERAKAHLQYCMAERERWASEMDPRDHRHLEALGRLTNAERRARSDVALLMDDQSMKA